MVGDLVQQSIADMLRSAQQDSLLSARWVCDDGKLLFPRMPFDDAAKICEQLRLRLAQADNRHIAEGLQVTASFGLSESSDASDSNTLIKQADHALYIAKQTGRNKVVCWSAEGSNDPDHFHI